MKPTIEVYEDKQTLWRWRTIAANGEIVASGESHPTKRAATEAAVKSLLVALEALAHIGVTSLDRDRETFDVAVAAVLGNNSGKVKE